MIPFFGPKVSSALIIIANHVNVDYYVKAVVNFLAIHVCMWTMYIHRNKTQKND